MPKAHTDREADKFEEIPNGPNPNIHDFPQRNIGTHSVVKTIGVGYTVGADGEVIPADDAHLDCLVAEDTGTADVYYTGRAVIGTPTSSPLWQIRRTTVVEGPPLTVDSGWADSNDSYDNVWDDRESLTYST